MGYKYDPQNYDEYVCEYMSKAYKAYEENDRGWFEIYRAKMMIELKMCWKCGTLSFDHMNEIEEYFWDVDNW